MAGDGTTVETLAGQPADNPQTQLPTETVAEPTQAPVAETPPAEPSAESEPPSQEQEPAAPQTRPGWDKAQQRRDEEIANLRKAQAEQNERMERMLQLMANQQQQQVQPSAAPQQPVKDLRQEAMEMLAEAERLADEDPYKAGKLNAAASRKLIEAMNQQEQWRRQMEEQAKQAQEETRRQQAWEAEWTKATNLPVSKGRELVNQAWQYANQRGLQGESARGAAQAWYDMKLAELRQQATRQPPAKPAAPPTKAPPPAAPSTAAPPAPKAPSASVQPVETSARPEGLQYDTAAKNITGWLLGRKRS